MTQESTDFRRENFRGRPWLGIGDAVLPARLPYDRKKRAYLASLSAIAGSASAAGRRRAVLLGPGAQSLEAMRVLDAPPLAELLLSELIASQRVVPGYTKVL